MNASHLVDKARCFGSYPDKKMLADYHDSEWCIPVHDDRLLFEMLILEGAQAGLNWETILKKRQGYRDVFYNFDPSKVAAMTDEELEELRNNKNIIRNRLKIYGARKNAIVFLQIQQEFGSFSAYLWRFVDTSATKRRYASLADMPVTTPQSDALSKDLKKRGMIYVGSTTMYAYMQAVGLVNDHIAACWRFNI